MPLKRLLTNLKAFGLALTLLAAFAPNLALAEGPCDKLFPDITCDNHQGRFEGFIPTQSFAYLFED
ncbi:MAG: hypothetical protein JRC77_09790, partial [Deltaproteobacteria bacterium]|nr:hypothetical protein [Deltaproteobacteria bacterium]